MASVLLYLALSACATTAVGVFAGSDSWESWSEHEYEDTQCGRSSRVDVHAPAIVAHADSRRSCHQHCDDDDGADRARSCDR